LRVYGEGSVYLNDSQIIVTEANEYTDIDLENLNAFKGSSNRNPYVSIPDDSYLISGNNDVVLAGVTRVDVIPKWWTI
jgi:hypothetical protein